MVKKVIKELCPPILLRGARKLRDEGRTIVHPRRSAEKQDLDMYWDEKFADKLDNWGEETAWNELQLLMMNCSGKVLDMACGTGRCIEILGKYPRLDIYGCDISDLLLARAEKRGIPKSKLKMCDATATGYADDEFDYVYSVGSLEHFTEEGILKFIAECARICKGPSFHLMPCSRSGKDEGWLTTTQSFFNNSPEWWLQRLGTAYPKINVNLSCAVDDLSICRWFSCYKTK